MLSPALQLLFDQLNGRRDDLTPYEEMLHKELLDLLPGPGTQGSEFQGAAHVAGSREFPSDIVRRRGDTAGGAGGLGGALRKGVDRGTSFGREAGRSGDSGLPLLQINCKETNCPNKKRK